MKCNICENSSDNKMYEVREMMFGYRDTFTYCECSKCGCLQLTEAPAEMARYYPSTYYSFLVPHPQKLKNPIKRFIKFQRNKYAIRNTGLLGKLIYNFFPNNALRILSQIRLTETSKILDVGCGSGALLHNLSEIGFKHLMGVDPYISEDIQYENNLKILKRPIHDLDGKWDLIMFHHSFEHIPNPRETLQSVSGLLNEGGICLIRVPSVSSFAWKHYKENWVQLDAPRHFYLHSGKSIGILAEEANLTLEKIVYDSTDFQFWGSEQYIKDIPLTSNLSYRVNPQKSIFSNKQIKSFKRKADELNHKNQGDACAFFLRKN